MLDQVAVIDVLCHRDLGVRHARGNRDVRWFNRPGRDHHSTAYYSNQVIHGMGVPFPIVKDPRGINDGGFACSQVLDLDLPSEKDELRLVFKRASDSSCERVDGGGCHSNVD